MPEWTVPALLALNLLLLVLLLLRRQPPDAGLQAQLQRLDSWQNQQPAQQQALRTELADHSRQLRQELGTTLALQQQTLLAQSGDVARTQNEQIDAFRGQLAAFGATLAEQLRALGEANERRLSEVRQTVGLNLAEVRGTVDQRLAALHEGNERKLEQMRATVDEKLHATLELRLGQSFQQVSQRLEQVHQGLGEMRTLARDVGSLNRVLGNVKTRGIVGEVQLAGLLEQVFTPEQYAANVETVPGSGARVEFAIRLPGRGGADGQGSAPLWLPIDAKFPREDHERLLDAQDRADAPAVEAAARAIEARLKLEARSIREKYVAAPHTTDFAILFVPTEGLYAEALRRPGLVQALQSEHRITLAGPTTLLAMLNSLQMGFRTLALERRSAEVWAVLGAVKTEFGKFGEVLAKTRKKLDEASQTIDAAAVRTRAMARKLERVEALPEHDAQRLLATEATEAAEAAASPAPDAPPADDRAADSALAQAGAARPAARGEPA
ncbi:DNA recombination protein RmuC [Aquabacterium sp. OR-4]|uniref:DNA recombination protein RmuC n=1 Tax=Aquabacterium sp. OR-4 TaxID=2978127 RepID=UPI0028C970FB|nr:DNA recombination protein RmuC [Aquabacterium sp. OR-4]MDT7835160.1 DNA recombination protein RmuC [Aquabacterium sp. OR-4]